MPEVVIKVAVSDKLAKHLADCDMVVMPASAPEIEQFGCALATVHEAVQYPSLENEAPPSAEEWRELRKALQCSAEAMDFVRTLLGRSARVKSLPPSLEMLQ